MKAINIYTFRLWEVTIVREDREREGCRESAVFIAGAKSSYS